MTSSAVFVAAPASLGGGAPYVRKPFAIEELPQRAVLRVTALGIVDPWLNGQRVGDEVLAPGWTSYRHRVLVSSYDVLDQLRIGENVVGAIIGNGWAAGRLGWDGERGIYRDRPAVLLELVLEFSDGRRETIGTGPDFTVATGAISFDDLYDGEHYDAGKHPAGWSEPGFDDQGWIAAEPIDWDLATLQPRAAEPIRRIEALPALTVTRASSGAQILDFGQILTGWVRLRVSGDAGQELTIRHAELLTPEGELEVRGLRTAQATDRYTLAGDGVEEWEPRFTFHGFRYAEITGWPGELDPASVEAVVIHTDMRRTGWFETSNGLLNRLHENTVWGMRGNFVGLPTDCPQRDERLGWTGDINAFGPTAASLYDVRGILGSWFEDVVAEHRELGSVPWYVPNITGKPSSPTALWGDVVISLPWAMYREYGDDAILRSVYPSMLAYLQQVEPLLDDRGIWSNSFQFGDWLDPDAPAERPDKTKASPQLVATAYLYRSTGEFLEIARLLGEAEAATHFSALHDRIRTAFRHEYVSPSGLVVDDSPTSYSLAIRFGLLDPDQLAHAGERLAAKVADAGFRISTGFAGTPHILDALVDTGHLDVAYRMLTQTNSPSFLYPVTMGATTIWERWDSVRPDGTLHPSAMTSLNHYALGSVSDWMHRIIGGLTALEPGYQRMAIAPRVGGDLTMARLAHDTPHGRVEVAWDVERGRARLGITMPEGTSARVTLPEHPAAEEYDVGPGSHCWEYALDVGVPLEISLETTVAEIARDSTMWAALFAVLRSHIPHLPDEMAEPPVPSSPQARTPLRLMLSMMPRSGPELEQRVLEALVKAESEARAE